MNKARVRENVGRGTVKMWCDKKHRFKETVESDERDLCGVFVLSVISTACVLRRELSALGALGCPDEQPLYFQPRKMKRMAGFTCMTNKAMGMRRHASVSADRLRTRTGSPPEKCVCVRSNMRMSERVRCRTSDEKEDVCHWEYGIVWMCEIGVFRRDRPRHTRANKDASCSLWHVCLWRRQLCFAAWEKLLSISHLAESRRN